MKGRRPRVEDLLLPRLLHELGELERRSLPAAEAHTTQALSPMARVLLHPVTAPGFTFASLARTAVLFVVDHEEFAEVTQTGLSAPVAPELPPLPYSRVAVECAEDAVWPLGDPDDSDPDTELELFLINEVARGEEWHVVFLLREGGFPANMEDYRGFLHLFTVHSNGEVREMEPIEDPPVDVRAALAAARTHADIQDIVEAIDDPTSLTRERVLAPDSPRAISLRAIPVEFAHLVNARGTTVEPVRPDRAERRRLARQRNYVHTQVYFVYIGDGTSESHEGRSDREYHVRWLVRGHWRHYDHGGRSWVRPYIKGPAGAPWRGRPVYLLPRDEVAQGGSRYV